MLLRHQSGRAKEQKYIRLMRTYRVEGLILIPTGRPDDYDRDAMLGLQMPVVLVDRVLPGLPFDSVTLNNRRAAMLATHHILEFGHRRVGAINGPMTLSAGRDRAQGYRAALRRHGLAYDERFVRDGQFREVEAFNACRDILAQPDRPTAFFVANNHMLIGVMRAIAETGLRCPRDVSIVSIDDFRWADAFSENSPPSASQCRRSASWPCVCFLTGCPEPLRGSRCVR